MHLRLCSIQGRGAQEASRLLANVLVQLYNNPSKAVLEGLGKTFHTVDPAVGALARSESHPGDPYMCAHRIILKRERERGEEECRE